MQYAKWKSIEIDGYVYGPEEDLKLLNANVEPVVKLNKDYTIGYFYGNPSIQIDEKWNFNFMSPEDFLEVLKAMEPTSIFDEDGKIKYNFDSNY